MPGVATAVSNAGSNGNSILGGAHGTGLQTQGDRAGGGGVPGQGSRLAGSEDIASWRVIEGVGLAVGRDQGREGSGGNNDGVHDDLYSIQDLIARADGSIARGMSEQI